MKIENAKKIEVWQFEDKDGDLTICLPKTVTNWVEENEELRKHFAELEAKESNPSEWVWFEYNGVYFRTNDGVCFEYLSQNDTFIQPNYQSEIKTYYNSIKESIFESYKQSNINDGFIYFKFEGCHLRTKDGISFDCLNYDCVYQKSNYDQHLGRYYRAIQGAILEEQLKPRTNPFILFCEFYYNNIKCRHSIFGIIQYYDSRSNKWLQFNKSKVDAKKAGKIRDFYDTCICDKFDAIINNNVNMVCGDTTFIPYNADNTLLEESESSEWVEFVYDDMDYRTKDGTYFEWHNDNDHKWRSNCNYADNDALREHYETYVKPKQEPKLTTEKLLEVIHNLEKRIEDLEADRSTLVVRTNDIYNRLNSAKLSL